MRDEQRHGQEKVHWLRNWLSASFSADGLAPEICVSRNSEQDTIDPLTSHRTFPELEERTVTHFQICEGLEKGSANVQSAKFLPFVMVRQAVSPSTRLFVPLSIVVFSSIVGPLT